LDQNVESFEIVHTIRQNVQGFLSLLQKQIGKSDYDRYFNWAIQIQEEVQYVFSILENPKKKQLKSILQRLSKVEIEIGTGKVMFVEDEVRYKEEIYAIEKELNAMIPYQFEIIKISKEK